MPHRSLTADEYAILVEQAPIMIWRAGTDARCDYFNERWLAFTGRTMAQEVGDGWAEGVHQDDFDQCLKTYLEAFADQRTFEMEYRLRRHDGAFRWILDRGVPFYLAGGAFGGFIGSCIDVTESVEAREFQRRQREAELARLRGMLPICAWCKKVRDDDGYWRSVEEYISNHSAVDFSHGICPRCAAASLE
jgi:PAS domain S-box-containing protein